MSMVRLDGSKTVVDCTGPNVFWDAVEEQFAQDDHLWKTLAMLALRENAGWTVERIGRAFGHTRGHVTRCLERIKRELRLRLDPAGLASSELERAGIDQCVRAANTNPHDRGPPRNPPRGK
jgi:hypothetical protein